MSNNKKFGTREFWEKQFASTKNHIRDWLANMFYPSIDKEQKKQQKLRLIALDKIVGALEEHKKEQETNIAETQSKIDLLEKYRNIEPPFSKDESEDILSLVCYHNVGFCCSLAKNCVWRDSVLNLFKISPKEYERIKNECHEKLVEGKIIKER